MQKSKINLSLLIEMFWLSPSRTSYRKNKRFFMRLDYHTLSFFPLFGILVIHLPYVNGKHDGKITKFAVTKLKACKDWNHSERQSDVLWLADIFYGIQLVTWTFLWWKRGQVQRLSLVHFDPFCFWLFWCLISRYFKAVGCFWQSKNTILFIYTIPKLHSAELFKAGLR